MTPATLPSAATWNSPPRCGGSSPRNSFGPAAKVVGSLEFVVIAIRSTLLNPQMHAPTTRCPNGRDQVLQVIEYQMDEKIELNRQKFASDPMVQNYLQAWRTRLLPGTIEIATFMRTSQRAPSAYCAAANP